MQALDCIFYLHCWNTTPAILRLYSCLWTPWNSKKELTRSQGMHKYRSFLLLTEESGLSKPQHWHGNHISPTHSSRQLQVKPWKNDDFKWNHTYIHDPIFKIVELFWKFRINKSRYFSKYAQTPSLTHVANADKSPSTLTWAFCEKPAFPLKQERTLYLTAVSRWLYSCPSAMHFANIKHLPPAMPHLPAPLKSRKSAFLLVSRLYLKKAYNGLLSY